VTGDPEFARELDCRGMRCPQPIIELARHLADVDVGGLLAVVATDPAAGPDVRAWCRMKGHELAGEGRSDDGTPRYIVRRLW
jgi:tRNA 2-thiouridine synthesizing protein A